MKLKSFLAAVICAMCALPSMAQDEVTLQTVYDLLGAGLDTETIIAVIDTASDRQLEVTTNDVMDLAKAGADSQLIAYLRKISQTDNGKDGIYWVNNGSDKPTPLFRCAFGKEKSGFKGGLLGTVGGAAGAILGGSKGAIVGSVAGGLVVASTAADFEKLVISGGTAKVVLSGENASNPVFRFYFPKKESGSSFDQNDLYMQFMTSVQSPNEFQCIKMKVDKKKTKRSFPDGAKYSVAGFSSSKTGSQDIVDFEIKANDNHTFEVTFPNGLEAGEYVFFYKDGMNNEFFQKSPFGFDFSVQ